MNDDRVVFEAVVTAQREGRAAALVTVIEAQGSVPRQAGSKMLAWQDGAFVGTVGGGEMEALALGEAQAALQDGATRILTYNFADPAAGDPGACGGTAKLFVEPLLPAPSVVVIGAGHIGKAVAELAKWLEFRVIVGDDRPGYATPEQIPDMDGYVEATAADLVKQIDITSRTCIVAVTRGLMVDQDVLPTLLATDAPYIGVIGARRRWALTAEALVEQGVSREALARVHAPVGLELGAETPKEIAVSIMAEVIMVLRGGTGAPMMWAAPATKQPDANE